MESKLILLVVVVLAAVAEGQYFTVPGSMNYKEAIAACRAKGAKLATILNDEQNTEVSALVKGRGKNYWIAANDRDQEGAWVWSSGNKVCFSNWYRHEPNNWRGNEDCAAVNFRNTGQWNDWNCATKLNGALCQNKYFKIEGNMNFKEATTACAGKGGRLANIMDARQNGAVLAVLRGSRRWFWIGANDIKREGQFRWSDGSKVACFKNWARGEPNDYRRNEDCTHVNFRHVGQWNDLDCNRRIPGAVCERP